MAKKPKTAAAEEVALLRAIRAHRDDDVPRLAYADWLEEHAQGARAEFIRVQCRLAQTDEYDPEWPDLDWRRDQLLTDARKKAWGDLPVKPVKEKHFHRGFIDDISVHAALFLEGADQLFDQIPLRVLRPLRIGPVWSELLASPHLLRLHGLDLHNSAVSQTRAKALAACPRLANLHELNLGANRTMATAGFQAILNSPHLGNLRRLDLNSNDTGDDDLEAFVGNANFPHLRRLDLSNNGIGPEGVARLARATWLSRLERLDLSGNPLGDDGARRLAESGLLAGAKSLRLEETGLTVEGLRALVNSPHLGGVTKLSLYGAFKGDTLAVVAGATGLPSLRTLLLENGTGTSPAGVEALAGSPLAGRLRALKVTLSSGTLRRLLATPSLAGLTWLSASTYQEKDGERLDPTGWLWAAPHLSNLRYLSVNGVYLRDEDIPALTKCDHLDGLRVLWLRPSQVTEAGMDALIASPRFPHLRRLGLPITGSRLTAPIWERITARFGEGVHSRY